jgi:RNA polymerase sigma-70 factor (ECF subfamily)
MASVPENEALFPSTDTEVIRILLKNHQAFHGFLRKRLPSDEVAEDLLQTGLLKAVRAGQSLKESDNAVAWFYRILRNILIDFYRTRAAEGRKEESYQGEALTSVAMHPPTDEELHREVCACMERLLPSLKPEYGELVSRLDLKGESPTEVADSLGITVNNLQVRLHRARQALKRSLELSCGACTKHGCLECSCEKGPSPGDGSQTTTPIHHH